MNNWAVFRNTMLDSEDIKTVSMGIMVPAFRGGGGGERGGALAPSMDQPPLHRLYCNVKDIAHAAKCIAHFIEYLFVNPYVASSNPLNLRSHAFSHENAHLLVS